MSVRRFFTEPFHDYVEGLVVCFRGDARRAFLIAAVAFMLSWWIYVPIHELSHAYGCIWSGGTVTKLEIAPIYGAALLQPLFPFIHIGSDYAGRLSGFDTEGNDLIYLITDAAPFVWTVLLGVPLLRAVRNAGSRVGAPLQIQFGAALPIAFAPFISLLGDYYEMGSILVSRVAVLIHPPLPLGRWRSDDLLKRIDDLSVTPEGLWIGDAAGMGSSLVVGLLLAFATYWLGSRWSDWVFQRMRSRREIDA